MESERWAEKNARDAIEFYKLTPEQVAYQNRSQRFIWDDGKGVILNTSYDPRRKYTA